MEKTLISLLIAATVGITAVGLLASEDGEGHEEQGHQGERDHDEDRERREPVGGSAYLSDPGYALYKTECGGCHMAYPPSMLPAASWQRIMGSLADHFGDNAELDTATADRITGYLAGNSAGKASGEYDARSWHATRGLTPPLRITETDYFRGQHHEIPAKMVTGNPDVGSFSRCEACHRDADRVGFDEHGVRIPGYGRWAA